MSGNINENLIFQFLTNLSKKGETAEEIAGGVYVLRQKSLKVKAPDNIIDTCGTGGDMSDTLNISTAASLVAASCGIKIAKHGNRSISSKSGSADMLENIGYRFSDDPKIIEDQLKRNNFCFMFAQYHHSAMKHVIKVRKTLGTRTIFNLLGPLPNPANAKNQILGVYDKKWLNTHCEVLKELGSKNVLVVHGLDGLDEISLSGITHVAELKDSKIIEYKIDPRDYGYKYINNNDIKGGDPEYNAKKFIEMLDGENRNFQNIVELNAGAALYVSGKVNNLKDGFDLAKKLIDDKVTKNYLDRITC